MSGLGLCSGEKQNSVQSFWRRSLDELTQWDHYKDAIADVIPVTNLLRPAEYDMYVIARAQSEWDYISMLYAQVGGIR